MKFSNYEFGTWQDPPILLFDEATSALDQETEANISQTIREFLKSPRIQATSDQAFAESTSRTAVFIAHRLSTIMDCDLIVVLMDGGVAEQGSHAELLAKGGLYANMWRVQQSDGSSAE